MTMKAVWKQSVVLISGLVLLLSLAPALAFAKDTRIESLTIVGVTEPVAGELPSENADVTSNHAYVDQWLWYEMDDEGEYQPFYEEQDGFSHNKQFKDGPCYALELRIKPESGYTLLGTDFYYDGTALDASWYEGDIYVRIVFDRVLAPDNADNGLSVVNAGSLNVRDAKDGNRVGGLSYGDVVQVKEVDGEWSKVSCNDIEGWVKSEFLLRTYSKETAVKPMKYTVTTANSVNIRKNIIVDSERVGGLKQGDEFYVTGMRANSHGELWFVLDYNGQLAYVKADLVAPKGEEPPSVPFVFDQIINSIMLNFSGSATPSTTAKRMIYKEGEPISGDSIKDNGDGSYEIVLFPDDGYNLSNIASSENIELSSDVFVVDSVAANADGSKTIRMVKRDTGSSDDQASSGTSTQQSNSGSSGKTSVTARTGDSSPVLFLSALLGVSLVACSFFSMLGRKRDRL